MEIKLVCVFVIFFACFNRDWIFLSVSAPFSYRLPVNIDIYTEKGQTKNLGNGRCTDEKRNQKPDDILVGHLLLSKYYQIRCFRVLHTGL